DTSQSGGPAPVLPAVPTPRPSDLAGLAFQQHAAGHSAAAGGEQRQGKEGEGAMDANHDGSRQRRMVASIAGFAQASHALPAAKADRKSTRLNSRHVKISYAVSCSK